MKKKNWIIIAVIVVLVLWVFSGYNGLVGSQEQATTELANVQAQYQRRADMMPQLAKIVKAYAKHEKETFAEVTKANSREVEGLQQCPGRVGSRLFQVDGGGREIPRAQGQRQL